MARRIESHWIAGPAGRLETILEEPEHEPRQAAVVCHPHPLYGGTMHNKVVYRIARGLRHAATVVLRFNFRGVGSSEGKHADGEGEIEDARIALRWLRERYPELPFGMAGFSFGSRVITRLGCEMGDASWLLAAGYPTRHAATEYLEPCTRPKVFIQSTNDQYGPRPELEAVFDRVAEPKRLIWVESTDHFFTGGLDELEKAVRDSCCAGEPLRY
jgi:alpha/beta superfamily hydrolase